MRGYALPILLYCVLAASAVGQKSAEPKRASIDFIYSEMPTWQETMLASRARLQSYIAKQKATIAGVELGPWYVSVPLKTERFSDSLFGEQSVDRRAISGSGGQRRRRQGSLDGET